MPNESAHNRYSLLDAVRGAAVLSMIVYHLCYNIFCVFGVWDGFFLCPAVMVWEHSISITFITVSGMATNLTCHGYRRGLIVSLCGIAVTAATALFIPEQTILFGVLSFLGAAMIVTFALRAVLNRIPPVIGAVVFLLLFILCYGVPYRSIGVFSYPLIRLPDALYQWRWLAFLGFPDKHFTSADFFPFLPWIFLYWFGYALWRAVEKAGKLSLFTRRIPVLDLIGRHSLIIYMAHQPVLYGICLLFFRIFG